MRFVIKCMSKTQKETLTKVLNKILDKELEISGVLKYPLDSRGVDVRLKKVRKR